MKDRLILDTNIISFIYKSSDSELWTRRTHAGSILALLGDVDLCIPMVSYYELFKSEHAGYAWIESFLSNYTAISITNDKDKVSNIDNPNYINQNHFRQQSILYIDKLASEYFNKLKEWSIRNDLQSGIIKKSGLTLKNPDAQKYKKSSFEYAKSKIKEEDTSEFYFLKYIYLVLISAKKDEKDFLVNINTFKNIFCDFLYLEDSYKTGSIFLTDDKLLYARSRLLIDGIYSMRFVKDSYLKVKDPKDLLKMNNVILRSSANSPVSIEGIIYNSYLEAFGLTIEGRYNQPNCLFWND